MMRLPWSEDDEIFNLSFNIIESYKDILKLNKPNIIPKKNKVKIIRTDMKFNDIQHWMREVIWYGHRSGKYLCNIEKIENKTIDDKEKSLNETAKGENAGRLLGPYIV